MRLATAILTICAALSACASAPQGPELGGSAWRLARFESPNEAAAIRASEPARYTLSFGKDGRLAAKLDCNRGTGAWQAMPADAQGGSLRLGPLATTRAMCPPDPLGTRLAQDVEAIRSYRIQDGRLYTSLPADAGVYVWERIAP